VRGDNTELLMADNTEESQKCTIAFGDSTHLATALTKMKTPKRSAVKSAVKLDENHVRLTFTFQSNITSARCGNNKSVPFVWDIDMSLTHSMLGEKVSVSTRSIPFLTYSTSPTAIKEENVVLPPANSKVHPKDFHAIKTQRAIRQLVAIMIQIMKGGVAQKFHVWRTQMLRSRRASSSEFDFSGEPSYPSLGFSRQPSLSDCCTLGREDSMDSVKLECYDLLLNDTPPRHVAEYPLLEAITGQKRPVSSNTRSSKKPRCQSHLPSLAALA